MQMLGMAGYACNLSTGGAERQILGVRWPASLTEVASFRSVRDPISNNELSIVLSSGLQMCAHRCTCLNIHMHVGTHTLKNKMEPVFSAPSSPAPSLPLPFLSKAGVSLNLGSSCLNLPSVRVTGLQLAQTQDRLLLPCVLE